MKVEIWSDIMCPFCYIGKRRFEAALEQFHNKNEIEVIFRSFELDPHSKRDVNVDVHTMLATKYNLSLERAKAMNANIASQAQELGLTFNFDSMILTNTFDAHRLTHFAAQHGKLMEMTERLFRAYFTESKHVGDHETLTALAADVGLDPDEANRILAGDDFSQEVRADEQVAAQLDIRGVPFFVINRKYAISGAQPTEVFLETLNKAWDEDRPPLTILNDANDNVDAACVDGVCTPPVQKP